MHSSKSRKNWLKSLSDLFILVVNLKGMIIRKYFEMKCRDIKYYLSDYLEGKLIDEMRKEISLHLNKCNSCRKRSEELKVKLKSSGTLRTKIHQGGEFWEGISELNESDPDFNLPAILYSPLKRRDDPGYKLKFKRRFLPSGWIAMTIPLGAILLAIIVSVFYFYRTPTAFWQVEVLKGSPTVGNEKIGDSGILPADEWLKTDSHSRARLKAGMAGEIEVETESALQLIDTKDNDYKIYLKRGKIYAKTWSPANLLSVLTPSSSALDRGSTYTIEVDKNGSSFFHVTAGNVEIKSGNYIEIIPAGAVCETEKNKKPGTPYFLDASTEFKAALSRFDFGSGSRDDLETILENSEKKDALSLWYLLKNAKPDDIKLIYDKLAELVPPPADVTYEGIKNGNANILFTWWEKLGYGKKSLWDSIKG